MQLVLRRAEIDLEQIPNRDGIDWDQIGELLQAMDRLTPRQQRVLTARFYRRWTLEHVGGRLGVTRERARQIQEDALERLRHMLGAPSRQIPVG